MPTPPPLDSASHHKAILVGIGQIESLTDDMRVADIVEILDQCQHRRDRHLLELDAGVRRYLIDLLKERLPRVRQATT
jgi:hypothetical protein